MIRRKNDMKFKINDRDWEIVEASQAKMCEVENIPEDPTNKFFGLCCYDSQTIYIWEDLHPQHYIPNKHLPLWPAHR